MLEHPRASTNAAQLVLDTAGTISICAHDILLSLSNTVIKPTLTTYLRGRAIEPEIAPMKTLGAIV